MTVTSVKAPPAMATLQTLLAPDDSASSGQEKASSLTNKISTATSALTFIPSLHPLALDVISKGLLYQCSLTDLSAVQSPPDSGLNTVLGDVWTLLDSLLAHCPLGWSTRLFKWCVNVLGVLSLRSPAPAGLEEALRMWLTSPLLSPVISLLNKCTAHLVSGGRALECMSMLFPACSQHTPNLNWLLCHVISLHPHQLTTVLLSHSLSSGPVLDLPLPTLTDVFNHLSCAHRNALRQCVIREVKALLEEKGGGGGEDKMHARLSVLLQMATQCQSLLSVVSEEVLKIATADRLMGLILRDIHSQQPTGANVAKSGDDFGKSERAEEDEGEILSDEEMEVREQSGSQEDRPQVISIEDVVSLLPNLICQLPGKEACQAVCTTLDVFIRTRHFMKRQEAAIEEGEIVRESPLLHIIKGCKGVMNEVLSRLRSASSVLVPVPGSSGGAKSSGPDLELAISLQEGMELWCDRILELLLSSSRDQECITWLREILACVSITASELQASHALARLLCHAHSPAQLPTVMSIYADVQARHFCLSHSTIQSALVSIQQDPPSLQISPSSSSPSSLRLSSCAARSSLLLNCVSNATRILKGWSKDPSAAQDQIRAQFQRSLHEQLLPLTQLLVLALPQAAVTSEMVAIYDLMRLVVEPLQSRDSMGAESEEEGLCLKPQSLNRMLQALLTHHFLLMKMLACSLVENGHTHLGLEAALGKSLWLISWCTTTGRVSSSEHASSSSGSGRILAYTTIMDTILSKDMAVHFSTLNFDLPACTSSAAPRAELLATNLHVGHSRGGGLLTSKGEQSFKKGRSKNKVSSSTVSLTTSHLTSHLTQLLVGIGSFPSSPIPSAMLQGELAAVLLDAVAPQCPGELKQWPDEETLKYSLERDLSIKHTFDTNPVLWQCLCIIADHPPSFTVTTSAPSALIICAPILRSLLTVLTQHWQRCCVESTATFSRELHHSTRLVECMAMAGWIPPPLAYVAELFGKVTAYEISLLLSAVNTYMKQNYQAIKTGKNSELKDTGYTSLIKGVLMKNIQHFGYLYARFTSQ